MENIFSSHDQLRDKHSISGEEHVSYAIHYPFKDDSGMTKEFDSESTKDRHEVELIHLVKAQINTIVSELSQGYIWHKDAFALRVNINQGKYPASQPYLRGETIVGDSLDDEWMIVFLLREITKRIPGSIARIQDSDGEFLLIEAADHIPSWLNPENSENRVFIYEGNLHIIPIAITAEEKQKFPSSVGSKSNPPKLQDALDIIRLGSHVSSESSKNQSIISTLASQKIQESAFGYLLPDSSTQSFASRKISEQKHFARCQIPVDIARILKARPELITRACEAFYTRDALGMSTCSRMTKFFPNSSESEQEKPLPPGTFRLGKNLTPFITTSVCFTKLCYAQLMSQQFQPPKIWDGIVPLHRAGDLDIDAKAKEAILGMKLTCGFEILCSPEYPGSFGYKSENNISIEDFPFETDRNWQSFKSSLKSRGYFGEERLGSQKYKELEHTAKSQFIEYKSVISESGGSNISGVESSSYNGHGFHPVDEIQQILSEEATQDFMDSLVNDKGDDDDSWFHIDMQSLEDMMELRRFKGTSTKNSTMETKTGFDLQDMVSRFEEFVQEGEGGIDGAEFLDEQSSSDEDEDEDEEQVAKENDNIKQNDLEDLSKNNSEEEGEEEEDIFASDYEERQAKKKALKAASLSSGAFVFDNGVSDSSDVRAEGKIKEPKISQGLGLDRSKLKNILTQTFGERATKNSEKGYAKDDDTSDLESDINPEVDEQELKEYMAALDAELSATNVGESFEMMSATSSRKGKQSAPRPDKHATEDTSETPDTGDKLEDLVRQYAQRSRQGISRYGPIRGSRNQYGYGPDFAEDGDDEEDMDADESTTISDKVGEMTLDDGDEGEVVDYDLNLAKNMLESFRSQSGLPGPGGNILSRLGVVMPRDEGEDETDEQDD